MPTGGGSSGGKSGDVRAGGAYFEFWGKDKITGVLEGLKKKALAVGKFFSALGSTALKGGLALAIPSFALLARGVERAAEVDKLAEAFGESAEQMSRFAYAAELAGVSVEEVYQNQAKFQELINSAPVIDGATAKAATQTTREFRSALISLQDALLPLLTQVTPIIAAVGQFARQNAAVVQIVAAVAVGLIAFGGASMIAGAAIGGIASALGAVIPMAVALAVPLLKVAVVVGLIAAAGYGLYKLFQQFDEGRTIIAGLGEAFTGIRNAIVGALSDMAGVFQTAFGGIVDAFKAGDLQLAGEIAMQGLRTLWARTVLFLTEAWVAFKGVFVDSWHDMKAGAELLWEQATSAIAQGIITISEFMIVTFLSAIERLVGAGADLAEAVGLDDLASGIRSVGSAVGSLRENQQKFSSEMRKSIDDDLKASEKAIGQELAARKDANSKYRDAQKAAARDAFEEERKALDNLRQQAAAAVPAGPAKARGPRYTEPLYIPKPQELNTAVKASFALVSGRQQFGAGDNVVKEQAKDIKQIGATLMQMVRHTAKLEQISDGLEGLGFGFE